MMFAWLVSLAIAGWPAPVVSASTLTMSPEKVGVVTSWVKRCVKGVCPEQYEVLVTKRGMTLMQRTRTGLRDTLPVFRATCGAVVSSDTVVISVKALASQGYSDGSAATTRLALRCAPPRVDSLKMTFYSPLWVKLGTSADSIRFKEHDSVFVVVRWYMHAGSVRRTADTTLWATPDGGVTINPRGKGFRRDTAVIK